MHYNQIKEINQSLKRTKKAIISLGCSFVEGQGAIDQELYDRLEWTMERTGVPMEPNLSRSDMIGIVKQYPELYIEHNKINWADMQHNNAFVNVLCKKYFEGEYTPINLGRAGRGNRATIKSLYTWPQLNWGDIEELIVLYVPSGQERFDLVSDQFNDFNQFHCMWPHWKDQLENTPRRMLWQGYGEAVYSTKSAAIEQLLHVQELVNWCKVHNAKLVITPAFDKTYTRDYFKAFLKQGFERNMDQTLISNKADVSKDQVKHLEMMVDQWPWDSMFLPQQCPTFVDLCLKQENITNVGFWDFNGVGTENNWITVCCHPSAKAHDLFASELHKHIKDIHK
tara:strand:- start:8879 stop:9895 length:1017 start_codon:yes stop_codon:yes gene_type:complete